MMRRNIKVLLLFCVSWIFVMIYYLQTNGDSKIENRALRLKDGATVAQSIEEEPSAPGVPLLLQSSQTTDGRVSWNYFDEEGYVSRGGLRQGEDPYIRNRFNQEASDNLPSNRDIPDTRNQM